MARLGWVTAAAWVASACTGSGGPVGADPADAALDAPRVQPDGGACVPNCHWDCFGGTECVSGLAWVNGYAPRPCCTFSDPWPGPGPVCSAFSHACEGGACIAPDP